MKKVILSVLILGSALLINQASGMKTPCANDYARSNQSQPNYMQADLTNQMSERFFKATQALMNIANFEEKQNSQKEILRDSLEYLLDIFVKAHGEFVVKCSPDALCLFYNPFVKSLIQNKVDETLGAYFRFNVGDWFEKMAIQIDQAQIKSELKKRNF